MGCDIHIIAETKKNGKWTRSTEKVFKNPYYRENDESSFDWNKNEFEIDPPSSRNYDWFAILANVRNGIGFAGISTGEGFGIVSEPKGLPEDLSNESDSYFYMPVTNDPKLVDDEDDNGIYYVGEDSANKWVNEYGCKYVDIDGDKYVTDPDHHSSSYLTLEELDNFDWNQMTMKYGVISLEQYKKVKGTTDVPESWAGAISGPNMVTVSQDEADAILYNPDTILNNEYGEIENRPASELTVNVHYEWPVNYREWFAHQIEGTIEPMRKLMETNEDRKSVV